MTDKHAVTRVPIHELIAGRWSPRAFNGEPVSREQLLALVEAARWSPSAYNLQPWRFVIWDRQANPAAFAQAYATLSATNQAWVERVPVLMAVFADTRGADGQKNYAAPYDTGAAAFSLTLQAHAQGLYAHQLGGFNRTALREAFPVPDGVEIQALIAVGRLGSADDLREDLKARELTPRVRRPLSEIAFADQWDTALAAD